MSASDQIKCIDFYIEADKSPDQPTKVDFSYSIPIPGFIDPATGLINKLATPLCPGDPVKLQCGIYSLPDVGWFGRTRLKSSNL